MKLNTTVCFFAVLFLNACCSLADGQVSYSMGDGFASSMVAPSNVGPARRVARRVRGGAGRIIPTFDNSGRFNRDSTYSFNETRPLAGLFAPDFELTASVFGGWNRIVGFGSDADGGDVFDDDFAVGIAYGRRHSTRLRSEFEFTYRSNESSADVLPAVIPEPLTGEVRVLSIMKNFIIDIEVPSEFLKPYVGIGIGYAHVDADFSRNSGVELENSGSFAWQPIGGVSLQLTERANFYVEYRYFSTTDLEVTQLGVLQDNSTYNAHDLFMGMRFEF
jgi:opacity protein-like surface antigen